MENKLKTYSFTLLEYNVEELRDELKNNLHSKGIKNMSQFINYLIEKELKNRKDGLTEKKGNLDTWLKKNPKLNSKNSKIKSNKEILDIYANKFGR
jgi:hypothetical protein